MINGKKERMKTSHSDHDRVAANKDYCYKPQIKFQALKLFL